MAKRFVDTNKFKKPFIRSLPAAYKIFWDFLYLDCDHAGIWIVDMTIAQAYIGDDAPINKQKAFQLFNNDEIRIVELDGGKKWFIVPFISFQYGKLSEKNRAHVPVISALQKFNLLEENLMLKNFLKGDLSPLQGAKEMEQEKEKEMEQEGGAGGRDPSKFPIASDFNGLPEIYIGQTIQYVDITKGRKLKTDEVIGLWDVFKTKNLTGNKFYENESDVYSHFIDHLKYLNFNNAHQSGDNSSTKLGTSEARIKKAREW